MSWIMIRRDLTGSIRMISSGVFSVSQDIQKMVMKNLLFVCNFTPVDRPDYRVGVPRRKQFKLVLNSDETKYGGSGEELPIGLQTREAGM